MAKGGKLLTGYRKDMGRSANRVKTKLPRNKKDESILHHSGRVH